MEKTLKHWPLIIVIIFFLSVIYYYYEKATARTDGHLIYVLDDAYIHMAIAKNFAEHGVWGITKYGFTSSTSSPLWTFLLAASYFLFGIRENIPFIFNIICAVGVCCVIYIVLVKSKIHIFYYRLLYY